MLHISLRVDFHPQRLEQTTDSNIVVPGLELENRLFDLLGCEHLDLISMLLKCDLTENMNSTQCSTDANNSLVSTDFDESFGHADRDAAVSSKDFTVSNSAADGLPAPIATAIWTRIEELNLTEVPAVHSAQSAIVSISGINKSENKRCFSGSSRVGQSSPLPPAAADSAAAAAAAGIHPTAAGDGPAGWGGASRSPVRLRRVGAGGAAGGGGGGGRAEPGAEPGVRGGVPRRRQPPCLRPDRRRCGGRGGGDSAAAAAAAERRSVDFIADVAGAWCRAARLVLVLLVQGRVALERMCVCGDDSTRACEQACVDMCGVVWCPPPLARFPRVLSRVLSLAYPLSSPLLVPLSRLLILVFSSLCRSLPLCRSLSLSLTPLSHPPSISPPPPPIYTPCLSHS